MIVKEYRCPNCGKVKEVWTPKDKICVCGIKMKPILSPVHFILKGRGWASNGYNS